MIVTHRPLEPCRPVAIPWCCRSWGIRRLRSWRRAPGGERPGGLSGAQPLRFYGSRRRAQARKVAT